MKKKKETGFEKLARLVKSESDDIRSTMATKDNLKNFATKDDLKNFATKDDLKNFATKDDVRAIVDGAKEEILKIVRPLAKAVDKDAVIIYKHENRIVRIEQKLGLSLKK